MARVKTRPAPGNRNRVITEGFSNSASEKSYRLQWPDEPAMRKSYIDGQQCGGCTWFAPFDEDWGLCCCPWSRHRTETVFEHFTCPHQDDEGWEAHSFRRRVERELIAEELKPKPRLRPLKRRKGRPTVPEDRT